MITLEQAFLMGQFNVYAHQQDRLNKESRQQLGIESGDEVGLEITKRSHEDGSAEVYIGLTNTTRFLSKGYLGLFPTTDAADSFMVEARNFLEKGLLP